MLTGNELTYHLPFLIQVNHSDISEHYQGIQQDSFLAIPYSDKQGTSLFLLHPSTSHTHESSIRAPMLPIPSHLLQPFTHTHYILAGHIDTLNYRSKALRQQSVAQDPYSQSVSAPLYVTSIETIVPGSRRSCRYFHGQFHLISSFYMRVCGLWVINEGLLR